MFSFFYGISGDHETGNTLDESMHGAKDISDRLDWEFRSSEVI